METLVAIIKPGHGQSCAYLQIVEWLEQANFTMLNPLTQIVTCFTPEGERVETTADTVKHLLDRRDPGNVQMWINDSTDLFISWDENELSVFLNGFDVLQKTGTLIDLVIKFIRMADFGSRLEWKMSLEFI